MGETGSLLAKDSPPALTDKPEEVAPASQKASRSKPKPAPGAERNKATRSGAPT